MDDILNKYIFEKFDDNLNICKKLGILWQVKRSLTIDYGKDYWTKYVNYEHTPISIGLNKFRCGIVEKYCSSIIDVGIGCGEFIKKIRLPALGYDVNPIAVKWLKSRALYFDIYKFFPKVDGITLWDVLEHIPNPKKLIDIIPLGCFVFVSLPIIKDFKKIYDFKHFRPMEHLTYFTRDGIINYFNLLGFDVVETMNNETLLGRESIDTFVFKKNNILKEAIDLKDFSSLRHKQGVYAIRNKINDKYYIGSSIYKNNGRRVTRSLSVRIQEHLRDFKACKHHNIHLQRALDKYGVNNFEFLILEFFIGSNEDLLKREQSWIEELNSSDVKFGYNICPNYGNATGTSVSNETRNKISLAGKGRKYSIDKR